MKSESITKSYDLLITLYKYLQLRQTTFDHFIEQSKLLLKNKISSEQFQRMVAKIMSRISIPSIGVTEIFKTLKNRNQHLPVQHLRRTYFQVIALMKIDQQRPRNSSQKQLKPNLLTKSIQRFNKSHEKEDRLRKVEGALDYIISSSIVSRRLKHSLTNQYGLLIVSESKLRQFLRECHIKQLNQEVIIKVLQKMIEVLTTNSQKMLLSRFYAQLHCIATQLKHSSAFSSLENQSISTKTAQMNLPKQQTNARSSLSPRGKQRKPQQSFKLKPRNFNSNELLQLAIRSTNSRSLSQSPNQTLSNRQQSVAKIKQSLTRGEQETLKQQSSFVEKQQLVRKEWEVALKKEQVANDLKVLREKEAKEARSKMQMNYQQLLNKFKRGRSIQCVEGIGEQPAATKDKTHIALLPKQPNRPKQQTRHHYFSQILYSPPKTDKAIHPYTSTTQHLDDEIPKQLKQLYPLAFRYYRHQRTPSKHELPYFAQLQQLLSKGKIYKDSNLPLCRLQYQKASKIFETSPYYVIKPHLRTLNAERMVSGQLANKRFLAVLIAFADGFPQLLSEMFLFGANPAHYYCLKVHINGEWKSVKTDDKFPVNINSKAVFSSSSVNQIWGMLLQKVFAKLFKSYEKMIGASQEDSLLFLCGRQGNHFSLNSATQLQELIQLKKASNFMLAYNSAFVSSDFNKHLKTNTTNNKDQYFTVLDIEESIGGQALLKLRSVMGQKYTPSKREEELLARADVVTNHKLSQDIQGGCFYLNWQQFKKYFDFCFYSQIQTQDRVVINDKSRQLQ